MYHFINEAEYVCSNLHDEGKLFILFMITSIEYAENMYFWGAKSSFQRLFFIVRLVIQVISTFLTLSVDLRS